MTRSKDPAAGAELEELGTLGWSQRPGKTWGTRRPGHEPGWRRGPRGGSWPTQGTAGQQPVCRTTSLCSGPRVCPGSEPTPTVDWGPRWPELRLVGTRVPKPRWAPRGVGGSLRQKFTLLSPTPRGGFRPDVHWLTLLRRGGGHRGGSPRGCGACASPVPRVGLATVSCPLKSVRIFSTIEKVNLGMGRATWPLCVCDQGTDPSQKSN